MSKSKDFVEDEEKNNATDVDGMGNESSGNLNDTESGENQSATSPLMEANHAKENVADGDIKPENGTVSKDDEKESGSAKDKAKSHAKNKKKDNENHGKAIEDPFQAMIASIGPGTTTLNGIGNMSVGGEASSNQNNGAAQHQGQVNYDYDTQLALGNKMADDVAPATAKEGGNSTKTMNETESDVPKKDGASLSSAVGDV